MTDQAEKKNILLVEDQSRLIGQVKKYFWDLNTFKDKFAASAVWNFGSGWTWLVANPDWSLEIVNTSNAENPLRQWKKPLLVIDVWEHAYYLNYQNKRADYVSKWFDLVNWEKVSERMG
jgi:Fe-Mn family superoxide dismutase